jgi:hypothetical protein
MPELPDLEVVTQSLSEALAGCAIAGAEVCRPLVVRDMVGEPPGSALVGRQVLEVGCWGKFLWLDLSDGLWLVINPKLASPGRPHGALPLLCSASPLAWNSTTRMRKTWCKRVTSLCWQCQPGSWCVTDDGLLGPWRTARHTGQVGRRAVSESPHVARRGDECRLQSS